MISKKICVMNKTDDVTQYTKEKSNKSVRAKDGTFTV